MSDSRTEQVDDDDGQEAQASVARYYDEFWAGEQERHYEPAPELASLIFRWATPVADALDVGCGSCNSYAPELARRTASYVGLDVSGRAVAAAQAAGLDARVITDAAVLPVADESVDLVVCIEVLEHLFAPHRTASEIYRVLSPGGRLVASVPNSAYWRLRANMLLGVWNPLGDELSLERPWRDPHIRFFTRRTLERMLRLAGFQDVQTGAHGGCLLDHMTARPTAFGQSSAYRRLERRFPSLLGATLHAVAVK